MSWPINTAQKELIDSFERYIDENEELLREHDILIWGAGVRGIVLGIVLEKRGYKKFRYIDNDERKWGKNINEHEIVGYHYINEDIERVYILIPLESGEEVKRQLELEGLEERVNFEIVYVATNDLYVEEFCRNYEKKILLFSGGFTDILTLNESNSVSLKDKIWGEFGRENIKILSIACAGMCFFYQILRLLAIRGDVPKEVWLLIDFELLTDYHHLLPRAQHAELLNLLLVQLGITDAEFEEYIQLAKRRSVDFKMEYRYSPQRMADEYGRINMEEIQKEFLRQEFLYILNTDSEELIYLKRILEFCNERKIKVRVILQPIDYDKMVEYYDTEFEEVYRINRDKLQKLIGDFGGNYYDMSTTLAGKDFAITEGCYDAIYANGQDKIIRFLKDKIFDR